MSKIVLVTGATAGIGLATATDLASRGYVVIVHGRTEGKARSAAATIRAEHPKATLQTVAGDLSRLDAIDAIVAAVSATNRRIDVLINNAGVWNSSLEKTRAGHEVTFAVNHLAPVYLSHLLLPLLLASAQPRIICVGSDSHKQVRAMQFDDINLEHNYHGLRSYAQSKLANLLWCYEYERRRPDENYPAIYNVQPGLVQTDIGLKGKHLVAPTSVARPPGHERQQDTVGGCGHLDLPGYRCRGAGPVRFVLGPPAAQKKLLKFVRPR